MNNSITGVLEQTNAKETSKRNVALMSLMAGLVLVYLVGFSSPTFMHNAAHDVRHGTAFPCH